MPKYFVNACETVHYLKEIEADSEDHAKYLIQSHDIEFDYGDIEYGLNFEIIDIEEEKRYA